LLSRRSLALKEKPCSQGEALLSRRTRSQGLEREALRERVLFESGFSLRARVLLESKASP
jgi:hypothetical protein